MSVRWCFRIILDCGQTTARCKIQHNDHMTTRLERAGTCGTTKKPRSINIVSQLLLNVASVFSVPCFCHPFLPRKSVTQYLHHVAQAEQVSSSLLWCMKIRYGGAGNPTKYVNVLFTRKATPLTIVSVLIARSNISLSVRRTCMLTYLPPLTAATSCSWSIFWTSFLNHARKFEYKKSSSTWQKQFATRRVK